MPVLSLPLVVSENCTAYNTPTVHNNHTLEVNIMHFQIGRVYDIPKLEEFTENTNYFYWIKAV